MPGKHNARPRAPWLRGFARLRSVPRRLLVGVAAPLALILLAVLWGAASTGARQPTALFVLPTPATVPAPETSPRPTGSASPHRPSAVPTTAPSRTRSPSASPDPSPTGTPAARRSSAAPRRSPSSEPPAPRVDPATPMTARYVLTGTRADSFEVGVHLTNAGARPTGWQVVLRYPAAARVRLVGTWNATVEVRGDTLVFSGGPLLAGGSHTFGFQATKAVPAQVQPTGCTANGSACGRI